MLTFIFNYYYFSRWIANNSYYEIVSEMFYLFFVYLEDLETILIQTTGMLSYCLNIIVKLINGQIRNCTVSTVKMFSSMNVDVHDFFYRNFNVPK